MRKEEIKVMLTFIKYAVTLAIGYLSGNYDLLSF